MKLKRKKTALGVLNRLAAYEQAREGISPKTIRAEADIDRKLLWLWRKVDTSKSSAERENS